MRLTRLEIAGVRNISLLSIDCNPGLNLFVGPNGAGKSAILEAVYILGRGRSFRSSSMAPIVQHGSASMRVGITLEDELRGTIDVRVVRKLDGQSTLSINSRDERRVSQVAQLMPIQLMLPDVSNVVFGGPQERRRFVDWGTFHVEPSYLEALRHYQRALQQRNAVLRAARGNESELSKEAPVWTTRLVELGLVVDNCRRGYLTRLVPMITEQLNALSPGARIEVSYRPGWPDAATLEDSMSESLSRDVRSAVTSYGPHRADLRLDVDSGRASAMLSRGEAKVVASAMRLAQAQVIADQCGRRSLFLIDDVGAELDAAHNERFFRALERLGCQVFATATVALPLSNAFTGSRRQLFHVEHGACGPIDMDTEE